MRCVLMGCSSKKVVVDSVLVGGGGKRAKDNKSDTNEQYCWPTAKERVERAKMLVLENQQAWMQINSNVSYCVDPTVAKELLQNHEDCQKILNSSNEQHQQPQEEEEKAPSFDFVLHKPYKRTSLLKNALTNVNGDDWRRQRPILLKALNNREARKVAAEVAAESIMLENVLVVQTMDARALALHVAVHSIAAAVVSTEHAPRIVEPLSDLYEDTLRPIHYGNDGLAEKLSSIIQDIVESMAHHVDNDNDNDGDNISKTACCCLAQSLLNQEPTLSRSEVLSNIHSALLAGTQTIATTLAGSLLHVAAMDNLGDDISSKAICQETLRILPPVASLPRCRRRRRCPHQVEETHDEYVMNDDNNKVLVMDLLAFAHVNDQQQHQGDDDGSSWKFCPAGIMATTTSATKKNKSYAWGMGERSCPAGSMSVDAISSALDALRAEYEWKIDDADNSKWIDTVSYTPTLTYHKPLMLIFQSKRDTQS